MTAFVGKGIKYQLNINAYHRLLMLIVEAFFCARKCLFLPVNPILSVFFSLHLPERNNYCNFEVENNTLSYGVMVALQFLDLPV
jgi:hypothetical protein